MEDEHPCDCGAVKRRDDVCCQRCAFLDAPTASSNVGAIVEAMRDHRWVTAEQLMDATGACYETVIRSLSALRQTGRVRREIEELEAFDWSSDDNGSSYRGLYCLTDAQSVETPPPTKIQPKTARAIADAHHGWTRGDVAKFLGVSDPTLSKWRDALAPISAGNFVYYDPEIVRAFAETRRQLETRRREEQRSRDALRIKREQERLRSLSARQRDERTRAA